MAKRAALRFWASILSLPWALPASALDADAGRDESASWVPALAALGDAYPRSDQPAEAAQIVPVLVAVGVDAASPAAGATDAPASSTPAPESRDESERWVPAFAFTSGIIGQKAEGSVRSSSTLTYSYFAQDTGLVVSHRRPVSCAK